MRILNHDIMGLFEPAAYEVEVAPLVWPIGTKRLLEIFLILFGHRAVATKWRIAYDVVDLVQLDVSAPVHG